MPTMMYSTYKLGLSAFTSFTDVMIPASKASMESFRLSNLSGRLAQ